MYLFTFHMIKYYKLIGTTDSDDIVQDWAGNKSEPCTEVTVFSAEVNNLKIKKRQTSLL